MQVKLVKGVSKKGNAWEGLQIICGEYRSPLIFPTKIEMKYIKEFAQEQAHKDFKGDDLDVENDEN